MGAIFGKVKNWLIAAVGVAGVTLVAYVVEHGELPEWMSNTFRVIRITLTTRAEWALWEVLLPVFLIGACAVYLLYRETVRSYRLQWSNEQLEFRAGNLRRREQELLKSLEEHRLKVENDKNEVAAEQALTDRQLLVLVWIARLENANRSAMLGHLVRISGIRKVEFMGHIDVLEEIGHVTVFQLPGDVEYDLTASGRKVVLDSGRLNPA
nr:hypothetical protein [uncultured Pseudomonas sp.]